jgi:hypothetical protein
VIFLRIWWAKFAKFPVNFLVSRGLGLESGSLKPPSTARQALHSCNRNFLHPETPAFDPEIADPAQVKELLKRICRSRNADLLCWGWVEGRFWYEAHRAFDVSLGWRLVPVRTASKKFYSAGEVAAPFRISERSADRRILEGCIPGIRLGRGGTVAPVLRVGSTANTRVIWRHANEVLGPVFCRPS